MMLLLGMVAVVSRGLPKRLQTHLEYACLIGGDEQAGQRLDRPENETELYPMTA
jgi:hypothetical protein